MNNGSNNNSLREKVQKAIEGYMKLPLVLKILAPIGVVAFPILMFGNQIFNVLKFALVILVIFGIIIALKKLFTSKGRITTSTNYIITRLYYEREHKVYRWNKDYDAYTEVIKYSDGTEETRVVDASYWEHIDTYKTTGENVNPPTPDVKSLSYSGKPGEIMEKTNTRYIVEGYMEGQPAEPKKVFVKLDQYCRALVQFNAGRSVPCNIYNTGIIELKV